MSINIHMVLFVTISLVVWGCAKPDVASSTHPKKAFEQEDLYILYALDASNAKQYHAATALFSHLYTKSGKYEYKKEALKAQLLSKDYDSLVKNTQNASTPFEKEMHILALLHLQAYDEATQYACDVEGSLHALDYLLCFEPLFQKGEYEDAKAVLLKGYKQTHSDKIAKRYAQLLYDHYALKEEAMQFLQTHMNMIASSKASMLQLIAYYSEAKRYEPMLVLYMKLYAQSPEEKYAQEIIKVALYLKQYAALIAFLKQYHVNDSLLLELYIEQQRYTEAAALAYLLYERLGEIDLLGKSAIFYYESITKTDGDEAALFEVVSRLKQVVAQEPTPLYLNYLGYLMIDHDMNVTEGISYVKEALKHEPESMFYLDSLAWGYYKQHECKKALALIDKVKKTLKEEDDEVQHHYEKIQACNEQGAL